MVPPRIGKLPIVLYRRNKNNKRSCALHEYGVEFGDLIGPLLRVSLDLHEEIVAHLAHVASEMYLARPLGRQHVARQRLPHRHVPRTASTVNSTRGWTHTVYTCCSRSIRPCSSPLRRSCTCRREQCESCRAYRSSQSARGSVHKIERQYLERPRFVVEHLSAHKLVRAAPCCKPHVRRHRRVMQIDRPTKVDESHG